MRRRSDSSFAWCNSCNIPVRSLSAVDHAFGRRKRRASDWPGHLLDAARLMRDANVGMLPVLAEGRLTGVITDRDLVVRAMAEGVDPGSMPVTEFLSDRLITARAEWSTDQAMSTMANAHVGRLPVVDDVGGVLGVWSPSARWCSAHVTRRRSGKPRGRCRGARLAGTRRAKRAALGGRMIRKLKSGQYRLYSRKPENREAQEPRHTFRSRTAAERHERAVQYFKRAG